jgi:hypothetical protein
MPPAPRATPTELFVLVMLLAVLALPQIAMVAGAAGTNVDGGYYMDVAMHVRDGHGLVSDVSLYHAGVPSFPHPTPIYPLWPLLLGHLGRLADIVELGHWVPFGFWLVSLVGAWLLGRALFPGPLVPGAPRLAGLDFGHLFAFALGSQREYSRFTTWPYTEGLGFALLVFALWRLVRMRGRVRDLLELGVWLTLLCLTRSQMFIAPMAVACAMGVVCLLGGPAGRRTAVKATVSLAVVLAALAVWWHQSSAYVLDASPLTLLRFDQAQVTDVLPPINIMKQTDGLAGFVLDRLSGVTLAWSPSLSRWGSSYGRGFLALHWALPLAVLFALPALRTLRPADVVAAVRRPGAFAWLTLLFLALGALASVHLPHKAGFGAWYFHRRHAIICVVPFVLSLAWLLRRPGRWARWAGAIVLVGQLGLHVESLYYRVPRAFRPERVPHAALAGWLQEQASADDPLVVAMAAFDPPEVAWQTDHVGYHWFYEKTSLDTLERMFDPLGADLLVFRPGPTRRWAFRRDEEAFSARFELLGVLDGGGERVYRWIPPEDRNGSEPGE